MKFQTFRKHADPIAAVGDVSLTDPQFLKDTDINTILDRYNKTGVLPVRSGGVYADVSDLGDFADVMERVNSARREFEAMPSGIRARFGHDPVAYFEFVNDPKNTEECLKLGIKIEKVDTPSAVDLLKDIRDNVTRKGGVGSDPAPVALST